MTGMRSLFVLAMLSAHAAAAAENEAPQVTPELRQRAEDLAGAASSRFTEFLGGEKRMAQSAPPESTTEPVKDNGTFSRVWEWLARSSQTYDDVVVAQLKNNDGWTVIVQRSGDAAPIQTPMTAEPLEEPRPQLRGWSGLVEVVRDWLARANRSYRNEVVKPLLEPAEPGAPSELVEQPAATPSSPTPGVVPPPPVAVAPQSAPPVAADPGEAKRKAEVEDRVKREAEAADAKRHADAEAQANREADAATVKRAADEAAAKRKADEAKRVADEAAAKHKADEAKRVADEAAARRKADEAKRVADDAAAKRKADQAKRDADAADAAERKAVAEAEAETKRQADIDAEATRRSEAASRAKQAARAEIASPAPATPQAETPPAAAPQAGAPPTPTAKSPRAAPISPAPDSASKENSDVAVAPPEPERKPVTPAPTREVTRKAREGSVVAEVAPPVVAKKRPAYKTRTGKKHASAHRHKRSYAYKAHRKPRYAVAHGRRHRAYAAGVVYVQRRCDCRCGRAFYKPRKRRHAAWHGFTSPRRSGLTYRYGRHYIR